MSNLKSSLNENISTIHNIYTFKYNVWIQVKENPLKEITTMAAVLNLFIQFQSNKF